ncbi:hypothetical protein [Vibrio sinaloensis]|uniref:hypothetical protein n=1 Tax=Photobacterium sp. (strain ATCC 43367) TaxID=379097 RepID=UPI00057D19E0|nr:hypothetical protein [Vibrio sinaloensis]KHT46209.1 hypothetical protein RJ47_07225 [Vibrio sinaloensis]
MENKRIIVALLCTQALLLGCVNNAERLGQHVAKLKTEQVYNPNATNENLGIMPEGSGERMEGAYQVYTGKQDTDLGGIDSQFLEGFSK